MVIILKNFFKAKHFHALEEIKLKDNLISEF